jgi:cyclic pyranopterin phosphate synthase
MAADTGSALSPVDTLGRELRDLRISLTDRCNFRCGYCMPRELFGADHAFLPRSELLSHDEIERLVRIFVDLGVRKLRITGGEPLVRKDLESVIERVAGIPGIDDICLTTNASLLTPERARSLRDAGVNRATVSLDAMDDTIFQRMNDVGFPLERVLAGIGYAADAGLDPLKVNMVVQRGTNDSQIEPMAEHFRHSGHIVRFIEFMDVGASNGWCLDQVVPSREVVDRIHAQWPVEALEPNYHGEVAERWRYTDGGGEFGVISSVTQPFCGSCTRARLSAEGKLFTCLFGAAGHDLRGMLREGDQDAAIEAQLRRIWQRRSDRYSEQRGEYTLPTPKVEMSYIGG